MNLEQLRDQLQQLEQEASRLAGANEDTRARLADLVHRVNHQIDNPQDGEHRANLAERTAEAIEHFEVDHPRLTETLNRIMVSLGI